MQRVLVTGGSGFVGSHLADRLVAQGYSVRVFDNQPYPYTPPEGQFESVVGEIASLDQVMEAAAGCSGIIHLASVSRLVDSFREPWACITTNISGSTNVLEAARRMPSAPWVISISSVREGVYPSSNAQQLNLYGISKLTADLCGRCYAQDYGLRVLTIPFSDVFGSTRANQSKVLPHFVQRAKQGDPLSVRRPLELFDFIYYEDAVSGVVRGATYLASRPDSFYDSVKICTGRTVTLQELAKIVVTELDSCSSIQIDYDALSGTESPLDNDPSKARDILGFQAAISLEDGIQSLASMRLDDSIDKPGREITEPSR